MLRQPRMQRQRYSWIPAMSRQPSGRRQLTWPWAMASQQNGMHPCFLRVATPQARGSTWRLLAGAQLRSILPPWRLTSGGWRQSTKGSMLTPRLKAPCSRTWKPCWARCKRRQRERMPSCLEGPCTCYSSWLRCLVTEKELQLQRRRLCCVQRQASAAGACCSSSWPIQTLPARLRRLPRSVQQVVQRL